MTSWNESILTEGRAGLHEAADELRHGRHHAGPLPGPPSTLSALRRLALALEEVADEHHQEVAS